MQRLLKGGRVVDPANGVDGEFDVLIEDFVPGTLDTLGIGAAALQARNPRLVVVSVTPFGQFGPRAAWKGDDLIAFAGLYDEFVPQGADEPVASYTILTASPNEFAGQFHNRMPVILSKEEESEWIDPSISEPAQVVEMADAYADKMQAWPVSKDVNNVRNNNAHLAEEVPDPDK